MQKVSFMPWCVRMSQELGATFKMMGKKGAFGSRNASSSVGDKGFTIVLVDYSRNIIKGEIRPLENRLRHNRSVVRRYDRKEANWRKETVRLMDEAARVSLLDTRKSADRDRAKDRANGNADEAKRGKGGWTVTPVGVPEAQAQGLCRISSVRIGVDGNYRESEVAHGFLQFEE